MFKVTMFIWVTGVCVWFLTPRVFRVADAWCAHQRISPHEHTTPITTRSTTHHQPEEFFDAMARSIRRQSSTRDSLLEHLYLLPSLSPWTELLDHVQSGVSMEEAFHSLRQSGNETGALLTMCAINGQVFPDALEHTAHILRGQRHARMSLVTATAQARLTMRILTTLPFAMLAIATVVSRNIRFAFTSPAVVLVIILGIALNRMGSWWVSRVVHTATRSQTVSESVALVDALCVAVQSGHSVLDACILWDAINPLGQRVSQQLRQGSTLSEALQELALSSHPFDGVVAHTLMAAHADGLPVHSTAALLAAEARKTQQAHFHTAVQQLPTKLSLPLVLCVLPSFGLLVLGPLLLAHLSRFGSFLPSPLS